MSNIEKYVEAKKKGQDYVAEPQSKAQTRELPLVVDAYEAFLLIRLAEGFSDPPGTLASELLRAALLDAWEAAGNRVLAEDEIMEHYGEEVRKALDEMG